MIDFKAVPPALWSRWVADPISPVIQGLADFLPRLAFTGDLGSLAEAGLEPDQLRAHPALETEFLAFAEFLRVHAPDQRYAVCTPELFRQRALPNLGLHSTRTSSLVVSANAQKGWRQCDKR